MTVLLMSFALAAPSIELAETFADEFVQDSITHDPAQISERYAKLCTDGVELACDIGWQPGEQAAAGEALKPACDDGAPEACLVLAWSYSQTEPGKVDGRHEMLKQAPPLLDTACKAGIERACVSLGVLYQQGAGVDADPDKAMALLQTACQQGHMSGCRQLGTVYHAGRLVPRDIDKALEYYQQACDGGNANGCNGVALVNHVAIDRQRNPAVAAEYYIKACDAGHKPACENLRKLYLGGIRPETEGAIDILTQGCERRVPAACSRGSQVAMYVLEDRDRGLKLLADGCKLADPFNCGQLGAELLDTDTDKGIELLQASCTDGIPAACATLGDRLGNKKLDPTDEARAVELWRMACDKDHGPSCMQLSTAAKKGRGMDKDKQLAKDYLARACDCGIDEACD